MAISYSREQHLTFTFENFVIGDDLVTTNATPTVLYTFPVGTKGYLVDGEFGCGTIGIISLYSGDFSAEFDNSLNTVVKLGEFISERTTYSGEFPKFEIVPNIPNQTIDFVGTGLAATTIHWNLKLTFKYRT